MLYFLSLTGTIQPKMNVAAMDAMIWIAMNGGTSTGRMPAKVSLRLRAIVTAGLANDVDAVNQYAPVIQAATANAVGSGLCRRETEMIKPTRPNVATNSPSHCPPPLLTFWEAKK